MLLLENVDHTEWSNQTTQVLKIRFFMGLEKANW